MVHGIWQHAKWSVCRGWISVSCSHVCCPISEQNCAPIAAAAAATSSRANKICDISIATPGTVTCRTDWRAAVYVRACVLRVGAATWHHAVSVRITRFFHYDDSWSGRLCDNESWSQLIGFGLTVPIIRVTFTCLIPSPRVKALDSATDCRPYNLPYSLCIAQL